MKENLLAGLPIGEKFRHIPRHVMRNGDPRPIGGRRHAAAAIQHQFGNVEGFEIEVPAARLDRREIEQCGDHAEHVLARKVDDFGVLLRHRTRATFPFQHRRISDDGIERCPQFLARRGEQLRPLFARPVRGAVEGLEFLRALHVLGDGAGRGDDHGAVLAGRAQPVRPHFNPHEVLRPTRADPREGGVAVEQRVDPVAGPHPELHHDGVRSRSQHR